jgi:hypothetical protein
VDGLGTLDPKRYPRKFSKYDPLGSSYTDEYIPLLPIPPRA